MQSYLFNRVAGLLPAWLRSKGAILCTAAVTFVGVWSAPAHAGHINPIIKDCDFSDCHVTYCDDKGGPTTEFQGDKGDKGYKGDKGDKGYNGPDIKISGDCKFDIKGTDCRGKFEFDICYGDKHDSRCYEVCDIKGKEYKICDTHELIDCNKGDKNDWKYTFECGGKDDKNHKDCKKIEICWDRYSCDRDPCGKDKCHRDCGDPCAVPTPASAQGAVALFAVIGLWKMFRRSKNGLNLA